MCCDRELRNSFKMSCLICNRRIRKTDVLRFCPDNDVTSGVENNAFDSSSSGRESTQESIVTCGHSTGNNMLHGSSNPDRHVSRLEWAFCEPAQIIQVSVLYKFFFFLYIVLSFLYHFPSFNLFSVSFSFSLSFSLCFFLSVSPIVSCSLPHPTLSFSQHLS